LEPSEAILWPLDCTLGEGRFRRNQRNRQLSVPVPAWVKVLFRLFRQICLNRISGFSFARKSTIHPETKAGKSQAAGSNRSQGKSVSDKMSPTFTEDTASKTGQSRRTLSEEQKSFLRGKRYEAEKKEHGGQIPGSSVQNGQSITSETLATEYNVSPTTIRRDAKFAEASNRPPSFQRG